MTNQEIREAEERAEKATAGKWWMNEDGTVYGGREGECICDILGYKHPQSVADKELICRARKDILELCKEVRRLEKHLKKAIEAWREPAK